MAKTSPSVSVSVIIYHDDKRFDVGDHVVDKETAAALIATGFACESKPEKQAASESKPEKQAASESKPETQAASE